jgi:hypothetical protein
MSLQAEYQEVLTVGTFHSRGTDFVPTLDQQSATQAPGATDSFDPAFHCRCHAANLLGRIAQWLGNGPRNLCQAGRAVMKPTTAVG